MAKLILKDESYELMGLMFRIHSQLGPSCKEKNYQDAIEMIFKKENIEYEREKEVFIPFEGEKLGGFFIDFLVWHKIILEVKCKPFITHEDVRQVMRYLQATGYPLAIIVNFKREKVEFKRVINSNSRSDNSSELDSGKLDNIRGKLVKYLGIDWGEARIGLALADSETKLATPFKVIKDLSEIIKVIKNEEINEMIIGIPYQITNYQLPITDKYNKFLELLKKEIDIPIRTIDERLSSKAADQLSGGKKTTRTTLKLRRARAPRDAVAAMIILQSYLDKL